MHLSDSLVRCKLAIILIRFSSHKTSLLPGILQRGQESSFLLSVQPEGETLVRQSGREASVMPSDFFLIDTRQPFYIETTDVHTRSVYIPNSCCARRYPKSISARRLPLRATVAAAGSVAPLLTSCLI
jgi:hypothetical protein